MVVIGTAQLSNSLVVITELSVVSREISMRAHIVAVDLERLAKITGCTVPRVCRLQIINRGYNCRIIVTVIHKPRYRSSKRLNGLDEFSLPPECPRHRFVGGIKIRADLNCLSVFFERLVISGSVAQRG